MLIAKHKRLFSGLLQRYDELIKALGSKLWGDILMCEDAKSRAAYF